MTKISTDRTTDAASMRQNDDALIAAADAALRADAIFHRLGNATAYPDAAAEGDWRKASDVRNALIQPLIAMPSVTLVGIRAKANVLAAICDVDWFDECTICDGLLVSLLRDLAVSKPA
jgi:hypothetical protein